MITQNGKFVTKNSKLLFKYMQPFLQIH